MTFEEFQDYILHHILEDWMEEAEVQIKDIRRNNGVIYQGLSIREPGKKTAPSLCLNDLYLSSKGGENMEEVFAYIREDYRWAMEQAEEYMLDILDFSQVRDKIIYRLVNYEKNREIEETCPTLRLFDLLLTFRWVAHTDPAGVSSALVSNREMELWDISVHELLLAARENTRRLFPPCILHMDTMLEQLGTPIPAEEEDMEMYILTNACQINGATVLLYEDVIGDFAKEMEENFYILPSSIHEMILVPDNGRVRAESFFGMVKEVNETIVAPGDILSDGIYYYDRHREKIFPIKKEET